MENPTDNYRENPSNMKVLGLSIKYDCINIKTDKGNVGISIDWRFKHHKRIYIILETGGDCYNDYGDKWYCKYGKTPIIIESGNSSDCNCGHSCNCEYCGHSSSYYNSDLANRLLGNTLNMDSHDMGFSTHENMIRIKFFTGKGQYYWIDAYITDSYYKREYQGDFTFHVYYPGFDQKITIPKYEKNLKEK